MSTLAIFLCVLRGGLLWPHGRHLWPPLSPQTSTPSVLLSTHSISSKSRGVKPAAAAKVKAHLSPGPFVQGCHYAGCDQATKFSSKINRAPSHPRLHPQGDAPPGRVVYFFRAISGRGPAPCLFNTLHCLLWAQLFLITLTRASIYFLRSSSPLLLSFSLALLSLISCLCISSLILYLSIFFFFLVKPRHPKVWKLAHPGPAPEALRTAPWVMDIVYSH